MNLLLFEPQARLSSGGFRLEGEAADHVARILKARPGDELEVGELGGLKGRATVASVSRSEVTLDEPRLDQEPPNPLPVNLVLALPRPKFLGRLLQDVTAFGVKEITLIQTARVEKSYWSSRVLEPSAVRRHLTLGLQQSRDTILPRVSEKRSWREVREWLPHLLADRPMLIAEGSAETPFPRQPPSPAHLLVGPEGGLIDAEIGELEEAGCLLRHLGPRALRVETAVAALLSRFI